MTSSKRPTPLAAGSRLAAAYASSAARPSAPAESAWQRFEMQALAGAPGRRAAASAPRPPEGMAPGVAPRPAPAVDPALLARIRLEARAAGEAEGRREGWTQGHADGLAAGRTEGLAEGLALASAQAEQLRELARTWPEALRRAQDEVGDAVLALALDVARQVIHQSLRAEPGWLLPLVQELLGAEPALQGEPRLLLHPQDIALVKNSLGNELEAAGWQLRADESLARGGCRVQCAAGEIDATLETRWERVTAALGREPKAPDA
ncbi:flagellar assembly protein FliH [Variovorax sp. LARHSF232]